MNYVHLLLGASSLIAIILLWAVAATRRAHAEVERANGELQQHIAGLRLLVEFSDLLQLSTAIDEASDLLPAFGERLFPGINGAVYVTQETGTAELAAFWGDEPDHAEFHSNDCWAVRRGQVHVSADQKHRLTCRHAVEREGTALVCIPMTAGGRTVGVVTLECSALALPTAVDLFAKPFADQLALGLVTLHLQQSLQSRAVRDSLTGLYNRRHMEEALTQQMDRVVRNSGSFAIVLVDVDHFKRFNDTFGHTAGDALLNQLGKLMESVFADDDVVCRYGGEEFLVILPDATIDSARSRAEYLRESVRELNVNVGGRSLAGVSISAGIAAAPTHGLSIETLIATADRALYAAKSGGRDRVSTPPPQVISIDAA
jgi:diguanylate cyclase (GGDEF)-like protein